MSVAHPVDELPAGHTARLVSAFGNASRQLRKISRRRKSLKAVMKICPGPDVTPASKDRL
jgi:hypothetical protein